MRVPKCVETALSEHAIHYWMVTLECAGGGWPVWFFDVRTIDNLQMRKSERGLVLRFLDQRISLVRELGDARSLHFHATVKAT